MLSDNTTYQERMTWLKTNYSKYNKVGGIYKIHLSDKHYYIGRSSNLYKRFRTHLRSLLTNTHNTRIQNTYNKYQVFTVEILHFTDDYEEQCSKEQEYLDKHFNDRWCVNLLNSSTKNFRSWVKKVGHTDETKRKMSESAKKRAEAFPTTHSAKTRELISEQQSGRIFLNKDGVNTRVLPTELEDYLEQGWDLGLGDWVLSNKGRVTINNGEQSKIVCEDELQNYLDKGWVHGLLNNKGRVVISKGSETKKVLPTELQGYLDKGWVQGSPHYNVNEGKVKVNNGKCEKMVEPKDLQSWIDKGWSKGGLRHIVINNGDKNKHIRPIELQGYISKGWIRGRLSKSSSNTGKVWINKDKRNKAIDPTDLENYLEQGWVRGRTQGKNKGRITINNGSQNKMISPKDLQSWIDRGWVRGLLRK